MRRHRLSRRGAPCHSVKTLIVAKNIGYELRCADPIPFGMEYTRDLRYCAEKYLFSGGNAAVVSLKGGHFVPVPFAKMLDRDGPHARAHGRPPLQPLRHVSDINALQHPSPQRGD